MRVLYEGRITHRRPMSRGSGERGPQEPCGVGQGFPREMGARSSFSPSRARNRTRHEFRGQLGCVLLWAGPETEGC